MLILIGCWRRGTIVFFVVTTSLLLSQITHANANVRDVGVFVEIAHDHAVRARLRDAHVLRHVPDYFIQVNVAFPREARERFFVETVADFLALRQPILDLELELM